VSREDMRSRLVYSALIKPIDSRNPDTTHRSPATLHPAARERGKKINANPGPSARRRPNLRSPSRISGGGPALRAVIGGEGEMRDTLLSHLPPE
jgi:hypothetical protein